MDRREFLNRIGCASVALAADAGGAIGAASGGRNKPNILFILTDDQTFRSINALNNPEVITPNMDRLVRRGLTFTHCYNQGSWTGAVCIASRAMLNTGLFLWNAKRAHENLKKYNDRNPLWSSLLSRRGYETYFTGKWHLKTNPEKVFDNVRHVRPGMPNQTDAGYDRPKEGVKDVWKPWDKSRGGYWKGGEHWSEVLADDAETFLEQAGGRDRPFFMYLAFNAPHDPRQSPKEFVDMYPPEKISVPKPFIKEYPYDIGCNRGRDERLAPFPRTKYALKVNRQEYYALITHLDVQVGRILDAMEKTGKAENTYLFFTSDQGLAVGHHGLMGKQNLFDHSVRVPFIVSGPGIKPDTKSDALIYLQDIMPTALDLAGAEIPERVQYRSLLPLINNSRKESYKTIYGAFMDYQRMVTDGKHKLILYPKLEKTLLFDLQKDPYETTDISESPAARPIIKKLFAQLPDLQEQTGDTMDLTKIYSDL